MPQQATVASSLMPQPWLSPALTAWNLRYGAGFPAVVVGPAPADHAVVGLQAARISAVNADRPVLAGRRSNLCVLNNERPSIPPLRPWLRRRCSRGPRSTTGKRRGDSRPHQPRGPSKATVSSNLDPANTVVVEVSTRDSPT